MNVYDSKLITIESLCSTALGTLTSVLADTVVGAVVILLVVAATGNSIDSKSGGSLFSQLQPGTQNSEGGS